MTLHRGDLDRYYPKTDDRIREALAADVAFDHLLALMARCSSPRRRSTPTSGS